MRMGWTDDPVRDAEKHSAAGDRWMNRRPVCAYCGYRITDEKAYRINRKFYCPDCVEEVEVEDWID